MAVLALALALAVAPVAAAADGGKGGRPQLGLRATPRVAFSPVEVLVTAQLKGGADLEEFYCPGLEWDWGDGTRSESETDCEPYEAGKSEIKRRYSAQHTYNQAGRYRVMLRLKRNNKPGCPKSPKAKSPPWPRRWTAMRARRSWRMCPHLTAKP